MQNPIYFLCFYWCEDIPYYDVSIQIFPSNSKCEPSEAFPKTWTHYLLCSLPCAVFRYLCNNINAWLTPSVLCLCGLDQTQPKHLCWWHQHVTAEEELRMCSGWLSFAFSWGLSLWDIPCWFCTVFRFFLLLHDQRPKLLIRTSKGSPLVLLASTLTGQWWSNDNYSSHLLSVELAPTASRTLRPRRKRFLDGLRKKEER